MHFIAVPTDIWTNHANDAHLLLTMHFVDSSWDMVSCILATASFSEHHTAVNIVDKVRQIMEEYNIEFHCLLAIVDDQRANMQLAGDMLCEESDDYQSLSCAAHCLQLSVEEGSISTVSQAMSAAGHTLSTQCTSH